VTPGGRVAGIDPSPPAIAYAIRRAPANATFTVGAAQDLGWPDGSFDVVTSTLAVHHIPEADRAAAFGEMFRVIRPGGRLLIADFRPSRWHRGPHGMRHAQAVDLAPRPKRPASASRPTATCPCCATSVRCDIDYSPP
jgi:ubiquinone/menaquinone biosynthesis C-methylase UbiE